MEEEKILLYKEKIIEAKNNIENNTKELAKLLYEVKKLIPKKEWKEWIETNVNLTKQTVDKYIKSYKTILIIQDIIDVNRLSLYSILEIGKLRQDMQYDFIQNNDVLSMSVREVSDKVKEIKNEIKEKRDVASQEPPCTKENSEDEFKKSYEEFQKAYEQFKESMGEIPLEQQVEIKEEDKPIYKDFYRTLSLKYHPDIYGDEGRAMKLINELKERWGI